MAAQKICLPFSVLSELKSNVGAEIKHPKANTNSTAITTFGFFVYADVPFQFCI